MNAIELNRQRYEGMSRSVLTSWFRHYEPSIIHGEHSVPNGFLTGLGIKAACTALSQEVDVPDSTKPGSHWYNVFPGEHYRLLKALVTEIDPKVVVEIGTHTGMATVAMQQSNKGVIHTFDIVPWDMDGTHLDEKFFGARAAQHVADLSDPDEFARYFEILDQADMVFMDACKDGVFEYKMLELFRRLEPRPGKILVMDDIMLVNMIDLWHGIKAPKMDMTSFGHWSGTGLVDLFGA